MYNAYKFVTRCRAPAPVPCPATPAPTPLPSALLRGAAAQQRSRTRPRQEQQPAGTHTHTQTQRSGGDPFCPPRFSGTSPWPILPGCAAGRGGSARLRGGAGGGRCPGHPRPLRADPAVPPASPRSLCRALSPHPLLLSFNFSFFLGDLSAERGLCSQRSPTFLPRFPFSVSIFFFFGR